jgi:hypothetical protein
MSALEGFIQVISSIIPTNLNPRQWIARAEDIKGADQTFDDVDALVAFHPFKMKKGMKCRVPNYPSIGVTSEFVLNEDPNLLVDISKESIIKPDNFLTFWDLVGQTNSNKGRAWNYAPDGPGGGAPVTPYIDNPDAEASWAPTFDKTKGHRWLRFRDDDNFIIVPNSSMQDTKIYTGWTIPIPVNQTYDQGDYIENRFMRRAISLTVHTGTGTLQADKWYSILTGDINVSNVQNTSRLYAEFLRLFGPTGTGPLVVSTGKTFQYETENTWTFSAGATVVETTPPPPRTIGGLPNNDGVYPADYSIGTSWTDDVPVGSAQLWKIFGPKSVYQQLKGDWLIEKVNEDPNFIRYSNSASPHPDTLTGDAFNTSAAAGQPYDIALTAAFWVSVYDQHDFMATRALDPGPNVYTPWIVEKIREESGEFEDFAYRLGPIVADIGDISIPTAPTVRDPTTQGWSETLQPETEILINYVTSARKFYNGSLKTSWSQPVPYTGKSTFKDDIISDKGDEFKYTTDVDGVQTIVPDNIQLTARVFKGPNKIWENGAIAIEYTWWRVFNNNLVVLEEAVTDADPVGNIAVNFGYMLAVGTPGTIGYIHNRQKVVVKATAVTGKAVFRVRQRVYFTATSFTDFIQEFSIVDISDGLDAKVVVLTSDTQIALWDSGGSVMKPVNVQMRYYQSNLNPAAFIFKYQKKWSSDTWLLASGEAGITIAGNVITINPSDVNIFTQDASGQEIRIAIMNWNGDPTVPDPDTNKYSDIVTLVKLSSTNVGTPGVNSVAALLTNESYTMVLNGDTGAPLAGEITSSGSAVTTIQLYDGATKKDYTTHWTISSIVSSDGGVTFAHIASGTDRKVYISVWTAFRRKAKATVTIVYGAITIVKEFVVATSLDASGAIVLDIDSNKGFSFDGANRTSKVFTAHVYNDKVIGGEDNPNLWYFKWFINNVAVAGPTQGGGGTNGQLRTINHADVRFSADVTCMIADNPTALTGTEDPFRVRTVQVSDITDTQLLIMWTDAVSKPTTQPGASYKGATATTVAGGATWRKSSDSYWDTHSPIWASDGSEDPSGIIDTGDGKPFWKWTKVYKISGEKGDQGQAGGFPQELYISTGSDPNTTPSFGAGGNNSSIAQMVAAGWRSSTPGQIPTSGYIWKTSRFYSSKNSLGADIVFDGNGYPINEVPFAGSIWFPPNRITSKDGINGGGGLNGNNGWAPIIALVNGPGSQPNSKIHQLAGWTGGSGPNPGFVGQYLGISGFVADINSASILEDPIVMQFNASTNYIQWKYQSESGGSWRNLMQPFPRLGMAGIIFNGLDVSNSGVLTNIGFRVYTGTFTDSLNWTNTTGGPVIVEVSAQIQGRRDSGGAETVDFTVNTKISGVVSGRTKRYYFNGDSEVTVILSTYRLVAPGEIMYWNAVCQVLLGGTCFMSPAAWFDVKIVG